MASSRLLRDQWSLYKCRAAGRWSSPEFMGTGIGPVPTLTVAAYAALDEALTATGYEPYSTWAYNCRKISGSSNYSLHSYGIAVDIDPASNPYAHVDPFSGKFTEEQIAAVEAIATADSGKQVWTWGGRWGKPDIMHFQLNISPSEAAEGIKRVLDEEIEMSVSYWAEDAFVEAIELGIFNEGHRDNAQDPVTLEQLAVFMSRASCYTPTGGARGETGATGPQGPMGNTGAAGDYTVVIKGEVV